MALVHVIDPALIDGNSGLPATELLGHLRQAGHELLRAAAAHLPATLPPELLLGEGAPPDEIVRAAREWGADLIVIGTSGRGGLARLLLGSTAEAVVRSAFCPVLTVRGRRETGEDE